MNTANLEDQKLLLSKWMGFSKIFYEAFPIDRYQGLQWFFIEILVHNLGEETSLDHLKQMVEDHKLIDNPNYYVPALLENLRSHKFVELRGPDKQVKFSAFSEGTAEDHIKLTQNFSDAVAKYVSEFSKSISIDAPPLSDKIARQTMISIYDFFIRDYVPLWRELLRDIARVAAGGPGAAAKSLEGKLRDDSVVYVFIHSFWENFLSANNQPVSASKALHFADRVRAYQPDTTVVDRLQLLSSSQILVKSGVGKRATYLLNPVYETRLRQYMGNLFDCTDRLVKDVQEALLLANKSPT